MFGLGVVESLVKGVFRGGRECGKSSKYDPKTLKFSRSRLRGSHRMYIRLINSMCVQETVYKISCKKVKTRAKREKNSVSCGVGEGSEGGSFDFSCGGSFKIPGEALIIHRS